MSDGFAQLHDHNETQTERRKLGHARLNAVLTAPKSDSMVPAMNLGYSIRALGPGQRAVLDRLFEVFEEHSNTQDVSKIFEHLGDNLLETT